MKKIKIHHINQGCTICTKRKFIYRVCIDCLGGVCGECYDRMLAITHILKQLRYFKCPFCRSIHLDAHRLDIKAKECEVVDYYETVFKTVIQELDTNIHNFIYEEDYPGQSFYRYILKKNELLDLMRQINSIEV